MIWIVALVVCGLLLWTILNAGVSRSPPDSIVVAVMGPTGSGKSSFIQRVTGRSDIIVGHSLSSETTKAQAYDFAHNGIKFTLVDTPGFDDTNVSNSKILENVLAWLESSYRQGTRLNGVIYMHRICDPRMSGSASSNLRMFRELCGAANFKNVVLATTFWEIVEKQLGEQRENELRNNENYWARMVAKGSKIVRLHQDKNSNIEILMQIARSNEKIIVEAQKEMLAGKSKSETSAARQVSAEVLQLKQIKEQELLAEKMLFDRQMAAAERMRKQQLAEETRAQREREKVAKEAEEKRRKKLLEREKKAEQERAAERRKQQEELKAQQMKMEELKKQRAAEEQEKRKQQRALEARQNYYRTYECTQALATGAMRCDKCHTRLGSRYYHCCFCDSDRYNQCRNCGAACKVTEHPTMTQREVWNDVREGFSKRRGIFGDVRTLIDLARDELKDL